PIKDVTVKERETAEFSVELSHENIPVVWYKNDVRLHPSKVVYMSQERRVHTLSIKEVALDDTSTIKVEALGKTSEAMNISKSCVRTASLVWHFLALALHHFLSKFPYGFVLAEGDLYFTVKLHNYTAVEKDEVVLSCELSKAATDVKWFKDGVEIFPSKNVLFQAEGKKRILVIKKCTLDDSRTYTCDAKDFKSSCFLNVEREYKCGEQLFEFECEVSREDAKVNVVWYKGEQELPEGGRYDQIVDGKKRILVIQNLQTSDAGEYNWSFRHFNQNMAFAAELAAEFISRPQNQEVVEGQKAEFTCSVSKETYNVKWMKDNKELEEGEKYQMVSDGKRRSLVIKNCEPRDEGGYVVVIGATRASADLTVQGKLRLIKDLDILLDTEVNEGQEIVLNCEVNLEGVKAKWLKNEETLFESGKYSMVQRDNVFSLRIKDAQKGDEANYSINLTNQRGEQAKSSCSLTVKDVPDAPLNVIVGNVTKFGCTVSWEPPLSDGGSPITSYVIELRDRTSVKWSPVQLTKADELSAIINDVIENKEYIFRVKAENKAGVGRPSAASQPVKIMDPIGKSQEHIDCP
uniref:Uncharacterized protein n=1 Tax=Oryzias latipes TaxID=8090 RepID=A0A3P9HGV8_ORYLA